MALTHYGELKRNKKLCDNNTSRKKGEDGFNPSCKHVLVLKLMTRTSGLIEKTTSKNLTIDETIRGHSIYNEAGSYLT